MRGIVIAVACVLALACSRPDPEARLRGQVAALGAALEARDGDGLEAALAEDFIGPDGMDRTQARRTAQLAFLRFRDVGVALGPAQVDISGDRATVTLTAVLSGGSGALLPDSANVYSVRSGWRLEGNDWRLLSVDWTPAR